MSDTAIENLQQAVKTAAASGPFALDAAFLTAGLNDPDVTTPADYDKYIQAAFQVAAANFMVTASAADVGPVSGGSFTVQNASIPFLTSGAPIQAKATLVFALTTDATPTLVVQAQSAVANWTWTTSFAFMGGWPFDQFAVNNAQFVFSTADGKYPWTNSSGLAVKGGTVQNVFASAPFPKVVQPALTLFNNLQAPASLALQGALDLSSYDPESDDDPVLLPVGNLSATIQGGQFSLLYLTVANPSVMLEIPAPVATDEGVQEQAPTLSVSSLIGVGGTPPEQSPYLLQIAVLTPVRRRSGWIQHRAQRHGRGLVTHAGIGRRVDRWKRQLFHRHPRRVAAVLGQRRITGTDGERCARLDSYDYRSYGADWQHGRLLDTHSQSSARSGLYD